MSYFHCNYFSSMEAALEASFGAGVRIIRKTPVYGGDINKSYRLLLSNKETVFVKTNANMDPAFFRGEAIGLSALRSTNTVSVPNTMGMGLDQKAGISFLLMEYLESAPSVRTYWEALGHELALMHRSDPSVFLTIPEGKDEKDKYGFLEDAALGITPMADPDKMSWAAFYRKYKLDYWVQRANPYFDSAIRRKLQSLLNRLDDLLREPAHPSLLHGDLWCGNVMRGPNGKAWIIDPVAYVGDAEMDLALTRLFGGFAPAFYDAYHEIIPAEPGYLERRDLYQLFPLLVHLSLFGRSYYGSVVDIIRRYA